MSRQVRQRLTALLLGALLLGAPLLVTGIANAGEPTSKAGRRSHPAVVIVTPSASSTSAIRVKTKVRRGTGSSAPMLAGKPPGSTRAGVRGVPKLDLPAPAESAPAAPARPGPDLAAQHAARTDPMSENGLIGLLAAVSIVLVLGVSAGVIRAIVSERAYRIKIA